MENIPQPIEEGVIYELSNFKVKEYSGDETNRAVRSEKHIYFTEHTTCVKDSSNGLPLDKYAFGFLALEEVNGASTDNRFLIGNIISPSNIKTHKYNNKC